MKDFASVGETSSAPMLDTITGTSTSTCTLLTYPTDLRE